MSVSLRRLCALFVLVGSHVVAQQQTTANNQPNFAGRWIATGYACPQRPAPKEEIIDISQQGNVLTATKVTGDACVGAGHRTWTGTINGTTFPVKIDAGFSDGSIRIVDGSVSLSADQLVLRSPNLIDGTITFRRAEGHDNAVYETRNNKQIGSDFDLSEWTEVGRIASDTNDSVKFRAGRVIAVAASSDALLPTLQFYFTVSAYPLNEDGTRAPLLTNKEWLSAVQYSSRFTGTGVAPKLVLQATSPEASQEWKISIPVQEETNDNFSYIGLTIYTKKKR